MCLETNTNLRLWGLGIGIYVGKRHGDVSVQIGPFNAVLYWGN